MTSEPAFVLSTSWDQKQIHRHTSSVSHKENLRYLNAINARSHRKNIPIGVFPENRRFPTIHRWASEQPESEPTPKVLSSDVPVTKHERSLSDLFGDYRSLGMISLVHVASATLVFHKLEGWSLLDSFYYCIMLASTVGYGDLVPSSMMSRVYTLFFILGAVFIVSLVVNKFISAFLDKQEQMIGNMVEQQKKLRTWKGLNKKKAPESLQMETNHRDAKKQVAKKYDEDIAQAWSALRLSAFQLITFMALGAVMFMYLENLSLFNAFYFIVVTVVTIGLGDIVPKHPSSKSLAVGFMLIGTVLVARILSNFAEVTGSIRSRTQLQAVLQSKITTKEYEMMDSNQDGRISKYEYLKMMLLRNERVDPDDINLIMNRFNELDADNNGYLEISELDL